MQLAKKAKEVVTAENPQRQRRGRVGILVWFDPEKKRERESAALLGYKVTLFLLLLLFFFNHHNLIKKKKCNPITFMLLFHKEIMQRNKQLGQTSLSEETRTRGARGGISQTATM